MGESAPFYRLQSVIAGIGPQARMAFTPESGCARYELARFTNLLNLGDSGSAANMMQDAGWIGGPHRWSDPFPMTCGSGSSRRYRRVRVAAQRPCVLASPSLGGEVVAALSG